MRLPGFLHNEIARKIPATRQEHRSRKIRVNRVSTPELCPVVYSEGFAKKIEGFTVHSADLNVVHLEEWPAGRRGISRRSFAGGILSGINCRVRKHYTNYFFLRGQPRESCPFLCYCDPTVYILNPRLYYKHIRYFNVHVKCS